MNPAQIQQKIYYGYAKAAYKLGATYNLYRSSSLINPIASGNLIGEIQASTNQTWNYMKANKFNNSVWQILIDAQSVSAPLNAQVGDYIVGESTYYIMSEQYLMPIQAVKCNATINVIRPNQSSAIGGVGYVGYTEASSTVIAQALPASILLNRRGEKSQTNLPVENTNCVWKIYFPYLGSALILDTDQIQDGNGQNYVIVGNELTELGWNILAQQVTDNN
jgi:hypothetical protein